MNMNPLELAQEHLQNSRDRTAMRTANRYSAPSSLSGEYAGYNSSTGENIISTPTGAIGVQSMSNGLSLPGEIVAISLPRGGSARSSQMPS